ncbi:MAG: Uma2 family endonuclease [Chloroflexota bacterium]
MSLYRGMVIANLLFALGSYSQKNPIGRALAKASYNVENDAQFEQTPALSFITREKPVTNAGAAPYMPVLAVEVQSEDQSDKLLADKATYYLSHGTRMVWLVYSTKRLIEVLTPDDRELLNDEDTLSGGEVLPDFSLPVHENFAE